MTRLCFEHKAKFSSLFHMAKCRRCCLPRALKIASRAQRVDIVHTRALYSGVIDA